MRFPLAALLLIPVAAFAAEPDTLKPLMTVPGPVVYHSDFSEAGPIDKADWGPRQGTQWFVEKGVLFGKPSLPEYQAKRKDHKGLEPRVQSKRTPQNVIARLSVRFNGGEETSLLPLVEFGHHNVRLHFSKTGVRLLADHESVLLAETDEVKLESGRWYHLLAERHGDEFVVQFAGGPTLYAKHKSIAAPVANESDGLAVAGPRNSGVEIDNVTIWPADSTIPGWQTRREQFKTSPPRMLDTGKNTAAKEASGR